MNIQQLGVNSKPKKALSTINILSKKPAKVQNIKLQFNESFNKSSKSSNLTMRDYLKENSTMNEIVKNFDITQAMPQYSQTFNGWRSLFLGILSPFSNKYSKYIKQYVRNSERSNNDVTLSSKPSRRLSIRASPEKKFLNVPRPSTPKLKSLSHGEK